MIYLNNAATTYPKPDRVVAAVEACLRSPPDDPARGGADPAAEGFRDASYCRSVLAGLLGIAKGGERRLFFSSGATEALNWIIGGLDLRGRPVLTTGAEHNAVLRPLVARLAGPALAAASAGAGTALPTAVDLETACPALELVPAGPSGLPDQDDLIARIRETRPGTVIVNHRSNVTGAVLDVAAVAEEARRVGAVVVVDASQSAGALPIRVEDWGIDALVFAGHKGLFGMRGIGGLYAGEALPLRPVKYGGTGRGSLFPRNDEFEVGTQNAPGIASLAAGVDFVQSVGIEGIAAVENAAGGIIAEGLRSIDGVGVLGTPGRYDSPIVSFTVDGLTSADAAYLLSASYGIEVRPGLHCAPLAHGALGTYPGGTVRASASYFTSRSEAEALVNAVGEIAAGRARAVDEGRRPR